MTRDEATARLKRRGYTVEADDDAGVVRITGDGLDLTLPASGRELTRTLEHLASDDFHRAHLDARKPTTAKERKAEARAELEQAEPTLEDRVADLEATVAKLAG